ncbi:MAG: ABC transporter permease [Varibaculum sp.]|nr:ABC transporter permease [Varibaculum sp.]
MLIDAWIIFCKELKRFFARRIPAFLSLLLPGILIYATWTIMGDAFEQKQEQLSSSTIGVVNQPEFLGNLADTTHVSFKEITKLPSYKTMYTSIKDSSVDAYLVFPNDFSERVFFNRDRVESGQIPPEIGIYYNSTVEKSIYAYDAISQILNTYEMSIANLFTVNGSRDYRYDLATSADKTSSSSVSFLPFLILTLIFSGTMAVTAETIAGEKERGTLMAILVSPVRRSSVVLGKVLACASLGIAIAVSSVTGVLAALPAVVGQKMALGEYSPIEYLALMLVVLSATFIFVMAIMIVSSFCSGTREAQMFLTPVMVVVMAIGLLGMFNRAVEQGYKAFLVPIYNTVLVIIDIFSFEMDWIAILITVIINLIVAFLGMFLLSRIFSKETILLN